ncbi:MAG TPA: MFS transporter [Streptosporangiaceae bacterium]|nr:MFS transporter [Streptosporangiaceae bacterium]
MVSRTGLPEGEAAAVRYGGRSLALAVLCVVLFLTFLDNTIVSVALGSVQTDLHAGVAGLQWVVGAYALTFAGAMLGFGMVGDEFGRKRVMIIGILIFLAGSLLSALAPNTGVLIAGRAVMGFGAAASEPGTLSMLRHVYTNEKERGWAVGVWTAVSGVALAFGPVVGGALVGIWDWRAIFWFNLLVGAIALVLCWSVLTENADPDAHRVDIGGSVFGAAAISALAFAIIEGESAGFGSAEVIALLCVCVAGIIGFFWWESRVEHPLLDLKFLRVPGFLTANVVAFCAYFATFAVFFFTALFLNEVAGNSGYRIALTFLPMTVLMVLASVLANRWIAAVGLGWSILVGSVLFAAGLVFTALTISPKPSYVPLAAALALAGIGVGSTVVPATSSALTSVPPERSGMAASATNTSREIGAVTGVAVLGALVAARLSSDIAARMQQLGISKGLQQYVIKAVESGSTPPTGSKAYVAYGKEGQQVINAAYSAFQSGLHVSLYLGAALVLAAGIFSFVLFSQRRSAEPTEPARSPA